MRTSIVHNFGNNFKAQVNTTPGGVEFWFARDLQHMLDYPKWVDLRRVIYKAKKACKLSGHNIEDHFIEVGKTMQIPEGVEKVAPDVMLSIYACYLIANSGSSRKAINVYAQNYIGNQILRLNNIIS